MEYSTRDYVYMVIYRAAATLNGLVEAYTMKKDIWVRYDSNDSYIFLSFDQLTPENFINKLKGIVSFQYSSSDDKISFYFMHKLLLPIIADRSGIGNSIIGLKFITTEDTQIIHSAIIDYFSQYSDDKLKEFLDRCLSEENKYKEVKSEE